MLHGNMKTIVLKIGGSLIKDSHNIVDYLAKCIQTSEFRVVVVPGGGPFADAVRRHSDKLSNDSAHWMAVLAMDQYGIYLSDRGVSTVEDIDQIAGGLSIMLPSKLLWQKDPLPHSWDVTSDTIAAWFASQLEAKLIKATDVDGIFINNKLVEKINAKHLFDMETCMDPKLPMFLLSEGIDCVIVNGRYPKRVLGAIEDDTFIGTTVIGTE